MENSQSLKESELMHTYSGYSKEKTEESRKKAVSHCLNLECKKEQLMILIKKLNTISGQRLDFLTENKKSSVEYGAEKSSISDELNRARASLDVLDIEIRNARHQLKLTEKTMKEKTPKE